MADFFIITEKVIAGPFTGIELREAALAGVLPPRCVVGGSPQGPWHRASDIGLFSQQGKALPHPKGTTVPSYEVRIPSGKTVPCLSERSLPLHQLIHLAAKGELPAETELRSDSSSDWVGVSKSKILQSCLTGELVEVGPSGKLILKADLSDEFLAGQDTSSEHHDTQAPPTATQAASDFLDREASGVAEQEDRRDQRNLLLSPEDSSDVSSATPTEETLTYEEDEPPRPSMTVDEAREHAVRHRSGLQWHRKFQRLILPTTIGLLFATAIMGVFLWRNSLVTSREDILGRWVRKETIEDSGSPTIQLGVLLAADGSIVICNAEGRSWTGEFRMNEFHTRGEAVTHQETFVSRIDTISPSHERGKLEPTDGHVELTGFLKNPPTILDHSVRDFFVRREGMDLLIGYPIETRYSPTSTETTLGWIRMTSAPQNELAFDRDFQQLVETGRSQFKPFQDRSAPHISQAMQLAREGVRVRNRDEFTWVHQSKAFSDIVTPRWLLEKYGVPDEARPLVPSEVVTQSEDEHERLTDAQVLRYQSLRFVFSVDGHLLHVLFGSKTRSERER